MVCGMRRFVILTYGNFPNGEAVSIRMHAFAKIIKELGYEVCFISMSRTKPYVWNTYDGMRYISIRSEQTDIISRIKNVLFYKNRAQKVIETLENIDVVMPLALTISTMLYCQKLSKEKGAILLTDCTEWYSSSEFKMGRFSRTYLLNDFTIRKIINSNWKVVSISRYFEDYFNSRKIKTTRIPAIMDIGLMEAGNYKPNEIRRVVYAGSPAKKDSLYMIIKAFSLLDEKTKKKIQLHVYGVEKGYYSEYGDLKSLPDNIFFYGRVSRNEVLSALQQADFTTLFRDDQERFTKAGFPSKVAESMSMGVPVITNYTSDLELYLKDMCNSIIVDSYSVESYKDAIIKASSISDDTLSAMHKEAIVTAKQSFDYSNYYDKVKDLLEG